MNQSRTCCSRPPRSSTEITKTRSEDRCPCVLPATPVCSRSDLDKRAARANQSPAHMDTRRACSFWWEIGALMQRCILTGWLRLIDVEMTFIRLVSALVITV
eukprot:2866345-Prymnesium_polylepis.1